MNLRRTTSRQFATCLMLSAVLILGIVQWSFLPVLIQSASFSGGATVEALPGHTSKFAAPSKFMFGNFLRPCVKQSSLAAPRTTCNVFNQAEEPPSARSDRFSSRRQLRAPPSI
jgi:hypothetical protein